MHGLIFAVLRSADELLPSSFFQIMAIPNFPQRLSRTAGQIPTSMNSSDSN